MIKWFDRTLIATTTPSQGRDESNSNKMVLHITQSSKTEASLSVGLMYTQHIH